MKTLKKLFTILAIILVAVMAFAPAKSLAAEGDLTITVTGDVAGRTLSVYKLFDLTVTGTTENPVYNYTWDGLASEAFFTSKGYDTVAKATDYLKGFKNDATELTRIAEEYYAFCNDPANSSKLEGKISVVVPSTEVPALTDGEETTSVEFAVPGQGYYLVYDETASVGTGRAIAAAMLSNVTKNTTVALKAEKTTVDKKIVESDGSKVEGTSANVGDKIDFAVTSKVPNVVGYDSYTFVVTDTLSKGLTLNDSVAVTIDGVAYTDFAKTSVTNTDGITTLTITFDATKFAALKDKIGKEIVITYSATVNADAATILDNTNTVKITYSNDPNTTGTGETTPDIVHVYTYKIDFTKKNTAGVALNGAKFILKLEDGTYATFNTNGVFLGAVEEKTDATALVSAGTDTIDDKEVPLGKIAISGLKAGTYTLIETEAPKEYSVPNFEFTFTISQTLKADGTLKTASFDYTTDTNNTAAKGYMTDATATSASFEIDVLNTKEGALPTTGGIGTTIFTIVGIVVMAAAVVALVAHNRKND